MTNPTLASELKFSDLGLEPKLLNIFKQLGFTAPTPIQQKAIPLAVLGKDIIGIAQTGTGKTMAFALPLLQQIAQRKKRGLIILPTRELAIQVTEELSRVGQSIGLRTALIIGGASAHMQRSQIRSNPHVIVGTPGRINDHLQQGSLKLTAVGVLILDEADRMLDMGFIPQIRQIMRHVPKLRQTMLFSATMPAEITRLAEEYMQKPIRIEVSLSGTIADRVSQELFVVEKRQKDQLLEKYLQDYRGTILVFSRTKYGAKKIRRAVSSMGHEAAEIHSNLSLAQRRRSLAGFKNGKHRILVATDIAARGIDVTNIELVVNYDLPDNPDDYVHRVGRTGRAGRVGQAVTFITPDQRSKVRLIERSVRQSLPISPLPTLPPARSSSSRAVYQVKEKHFSRNHRRATFSYARPPRQNHKVNPSRLSHQHSKRRTARVHS